MQVKFDEIQTCKLFCYKYLQNLIIHMTFRISYLEEKNIALYNFWFGKPIPLNLPDLSCDLGQAAIFFLGIQAGRCCEFEKVFARMLANSTSSSRNFVGIQISFVLWIVLELFWHDISEIVCFFTICKLTSLE